MQNRSSYTLYQRGGIFYYNIPAKITGGRRLRGSCGTDNEKEAHAIAFSIVNELKQQNIYGKKPTMSLATAAEKHWNEHAQFLKSGGDTVSMHVKELLGYFGANTYLHDITIDKLRQFRAWKKNKTAHGKGKRLVTSSTVNRALEVYRAIYYMAAKDWKVEVPEINFKAVMFPKEDRNISYLSEKQIEDIIAKTDEQHVKNMVRFAFMTGQRWSNVSALRWESIDLEKRIIQFRVKSIKKNGKLVYFEIYEALFDFLLTLEPKEKGFVFTRDGSPVNRIRRAFKTACKRAGITLPRGQNVHILRHSAITYMLSCGVPPHVVKEIVGHEDIDTTMKYTHVANNVKRDWLDKAYLAQNGHTREVRKNDTAL